MSSQDIWLDPNIRNWVLLPITLTMIMFGVLRSNVMALMQPTPTPRPLKEPARRILVRSALLRANANHLPKSDFENRRAVLSEALVSGDYLSKPPSDGTESQQPNPLSDPDQMQGMMQGVKQQMMMFIPQTVIMGWINYFFSGFVLIKLPFPLTLRFKSMMQRGIDTTDMDVTWVSSLSWYFLNLFGLGSVYRLLLGDDNAADGTRDMQAMQSLTGAMPGGAVGAPKDFSKLFAAESESLDLIDHAWILDDVEGRILRSRGYDVM